jgi:hypothetical protein
LTQGDVEARARLGLGPVRPEHIASSCDLDHPKSDYLDKALVILDIKNAEDRIRRIEQLKLICNLHKLIRLVEGQETDARKAEAFQRAPRWYKRRDQAARLLKKADELEKSGKKNHTKPLYEKARSLLQSVPSLPQALEQEAWRLQALGLSRDESFGKLRDFHKQHSRAGRKASDALSFTVHALQAFAASKGLIWTEGRAPPKLIKFIAAVLRSAKIKDCKRELIENRSRFLDLLLKPTKSQPMRSAPASMDRPETDLERRLSKVFL